MLKRFFLAALLIAIADPILLYVLYTRVDAWVAIGIIVVPILFGPVWVNMARGNAQSPSPDVDAPLFSGSFGDEILFFAARALFIFPGPLSTVLAALLLLPMVRRTLQAWAVRRLERAILSGKVSVTTGVNGVVMDAGRSASSGTMHPFAPAENLKRAEGKIIETPEQLPPPPDVT